jgi:hypothetical protein
MILLHLIGIGVDAMISQQVFTFEAPDMELVGATLRGAMTAARR